MFNVFLDAAQAAQSSGTGSLIMMGVMVVVLIGFMVISSRKSKKEKRQYEDMLENLAVGDEVTTIGGVIGRIVSVKGETVLIETGRDKVKIRFLRSAIKNVDVKAEDAVN
jgi:preprotein translocase subunit YajC